MSFFTLLMLLTLIIIVPVFFILKEKSKQSQFDTTERHQQYLEAATKPILSTDKASDSALNGNVPNGKPLNSNAPKLKLIEFSSNHAFIQLLYDEQLPATFRAIMDDIGQQYERTHHEQITESQLFTLNKLIETRVPELLRDYLSLDPSYAKSVIIDKDKNATSYVMVLGQLQSILDFAQKLNEQSQSGVVDKLLASRRYLDEVAQESGSCHNVTNDLLDLK